MIEYESDVLLQARKEMAKGDRKTWGIRGLFKNTNIRVVLRLPKIPFVPQAVKCFNNV